MRLLIMGPPGAGKGTQAEAVCRLHGIAAISTGDIFRANVSAGTPLGLEARSYMNAGEYVPDDLTNALVRDRITDSDCHRGFLLDGYPRTLDQVTELDAVLKGLDTELDGVLVLTADADELARRLVLRARTQGRADDTEDVIRRRQEVYADQTAPLVVAYGARGILMSIDGNGRADHVTDRLHTAIARLRQVARYA